MTISAESLTHTPHKLECDRAIIDHALRVTKQVKQPLFAYPGVHFYLNANLEVVPLTTRAISRRDVSQHDLISLQQHFLFYLPPKTAAYHIVIVALNADGKPHSSIHQTPDKISIAWFDLVSKKSSSTVVSTKNTHQSTPEGIQ